MRVWLLLNDRMGRDCIIEGVFDTESKAIDYRKEIGLTVTSSFIKEEEVR